MRQVRAGKYQFTFGKGADAITDKTGSPSFYHNKKLVFRMRVPAGIEMIFVQFPDHKNLRGWNFRLMYRCLQKTVNYLVCKINIELRIKNSQFWIK